MLIKVCVSCECKSIFADFQTAEKTNAQHYNGQYCKPPAETVLYLTQSGFCHHVFHRFAGLSTILFLPQGSCDH